VIPTLAQIVAALIGAARLYRFDPAGFDRFERTERAFWQSFFCAVLVAPLSIALTMLEFSIPPPEDVPVAPAPDLLALVAVRAIAYVINWTAFPLAMAYLTRQIDRADRYFPYMVAYNWVTAPQYAVTLVVAVVAEWSGLPGPLPTILDLAALAYALAVLLFVAHHALDIGRGTAALIVAIDFLLGALIQEVARAITG